MNTFYNNFREQVENTRKNEEDRERSFGEQMFPVVIAGNIGKGIIHVLSFCGASILPAYGFELLFGSFYLGLILGAICVLVFIEIPKWSVVKTVSNNYFDSNIVSYGLSLVALLFIAPSIASSTFGVPVAVWWCSPDAELISLIEIEDKYKNESSKAVARWEPQINKHSKDASIYFKKNRKKDEVTKEWRLSSSRNIQEPYNDMLKAEKKATKSLNARLDSIQSFLERDIKEAKAENKTLQASHDFKKQHAGNIAFWVMMLLEFCYILIVFGLDYIKWRSKLELRGAEPNQNSNIIDIRTESNQSEQERPIEKQAVAKRNPIKFGNEHHGQIFTPQGKNKQRVRYKKEDGSFTQYTKADLLRMANRDKGTEEFKEECKRLALLMD